MGDRWHQLTAVLVSLAAALATLVPTAALGQTAQDEADRQRQEEIASEMSAIAKSFDEAVAAEADLLAALQVSRDRKADLDTQIASLDSQIASLRVEIVAAEEEVGAAALRVALAQAQLQVAEDELATAKREFEGQIVDLYTGANLGEFFEMASSLTETDNLEELQLTVGYSESVVRWRRNVVADHTHLVDATVQLAEEVARRQAEAAAVRDRLLAHQAELRETRSAQQAAMAEVEREVDIQKGLVADVQARQASYEARLADLEQESSEIEAELARREEQRRIEEERRRAEAAAAAQAAGQPPPTTTDERPEGRLQYPIPGAPITSGYGPRTHPIFGTTRMHTGVDIGAGTGTPILAAEDGEVVSAGARGGYGITVVVDHGGGLATLYAHQSALAVTEGDIVARGEVIGYVGSTGYSTGSHLHFEVRESGTPVDPMPYL